MKIFLGTAAGIFLCFLAICVALWQPIVGPWVQERKGYANLRQAEQERQILIEQAKAERDAAELRAQAIGIVGQAAKDFPEYRLQEFMGSFAEALMSDKIEKIVYIPTEANIPILEAGKRD